MAMYLGDKAVKIMRNNQYCRIRSGVKIRNPKNLIPFPYKDGSHTLKGITWTVNADGTVTANGTATATSGFLLSANADFIKPNTQYIYTAVPKGSNDNFETFNFYAFISATKNGVWYKEYGETGNGIVFTAENGCVFNIYLWIRAGTVVNNLTFNPILNDYYYD